MRGLPLCVFALAGCSGVRAHGPPETAYKVHYFEMDPAPIREAALAVFESWKVPIRSDDGRIIRTRSFRDGPSTWKMRVEVDYAGGTTAVLVKMDILAGGDVEADVAETDYENIVRWQIGGDPDAFTLPEAPTHADEVKAELVAWLKRWRLYRRAAPEPSDEERARNRRELFLSCLRIRLNP